MSATHQLEASQNVRETLDVWVDNPSGMIQGDTYALSDKARKLFLAGREDQGIADQEVVEGDPTVFPSILPFKGLRANGCTGCFDFPQKGP